MAYVEAANSIFVSVDTRNFLAIRARRRYSINRFRLQGADRDLHRSRRAIGKCSGYETIERPGAVLFLADDIDMDALFALANCEVLLLGAVGGEVSNVGSKAHITIAHVIRVAQLIEIIFHIQPGAEFSGVVEIALLNFLFILLVLLLVRIPMSAIAADNADLPSLHRLAEKIAGFHFDLRNLARQVISLVGGRLNRELRKLIAADP